MDLVFLGLHFLKEATDVVLQNRNLGWAQLVHRHSEANFALRSLVEFGQIPGILRLGPGIHRALLDGQRAIRNHQIQIVVDRIAETLATLARSERTIETEQGGLRIYELLA